MKYLIPLFCTIILLSCGNDNSELYLILRDENKELFDKNNELIKSIEEKNQLIEIRIDSLDSVIEKYINEKLQKEKDEEKSLEQIREHLFGSEWK